MRAQLNPLRRYLPAIAVSLMAIGTPLLAGFEQVRGNQAAAIFPPGWSHSDVVLAAARADLALIGFGAFSNIGIVRLEDEHSPAALRGAGALVLLPPGTLGGCLQPRVTTSPSVARAAMIGTAI